MREGTEYIIENSHNYEIYFISKLDTSKKYLLSEKEGVEYFERYIKIVPNGATPNYFFLVSSITFGGIPLIKIPQDHKVNYCCHDENQHEGLLLLKLINHRNRRPSANRCHIRSKITACRFALLPEF